MKLNWITEDVPVAANMDAIVFIVQTAVLQTLQN